MSRDELEKLVITLEEEMYLAAEELRFEYAAKLRDEIKELRRECRPSSRLDGERASHARRSVRVGLHSALPRYDENATHQIQRSPASTTCSASSPTPRKREEFRLRSQWSPTKKRPGRGEMPES